MTEHGDQLRTAFETHEHLAPDAADVYSRVQELSRSYQRRRRGLQAAGGAALGVSLIAGVISLPGLLPDQQRPSVNVGAATAPNMSPSAPSAPPAPTVFETLPNGEQEKRRAAYFAAGYDYDDAVELAKRWNKSSDDILAIKAEAGGKLLAGESLPIKPGAASPATVTPTISKTEQKLLDAYFGAGYNYDDAVKLAKLWKLPDPYRAKIEGGKKLLAHKKLPVKPSAVAEAKEAARVKAFFDAGYVYDDAVRLATLWKKSDPYQAKIEAGRRILAGDSLPFKP